MRLMLGWQEETLHRTTNVMATFFGEMTATTTTLVGGFWRIVTDPFNGRREASILELGDNVQRLDYATTALGMTDELAGALTADSADEADDVLVADQQRGLL